MGKTKRRKNNGFDVNDIILPRYLLWGGVKNCKFILKLVMYSTYEMHPLKKLYLFFKSSILIFYVSLIFTPQTPTNRGLGSDSYTDGLFPVLSTISGRIFSFNNILLKISPPYREDAPKICTTLLSAVSIF